MEKITFEELYQLITGQDLYNRDSDGDYNHSATKESVEDIFYKLQQKGLTSPSQIQ